MKRRICIIYTGGTIGMVPSDKGYVPSPNTLRKTLDAISDIMPDMPCLSLLRPTQTGISDLTPDTF